MPGSVKRIIRYTLELEVLFSQDSLKKTDLQGEKTLLLNDE